MRRTIRPPARRVSAFAIALALLAGCTRGASLAAPRQVADGAAGGRAPARPAPAAACAMSAPDQAWIDRTIAAWRLTSRELTPVGRARPITVLLFSRDCLLTSASAMNGDGPPAWTATAHGGTVRTPWGDSVPARVVSFATEQDGGAYFVMSTPSVWRAGNVPGGPLGLEMLMTAVLIHEGTHVSQAYGAQFTALSKTHALSDDWNDDTIQKTYEDSAGFAASVARETDLLYAAAAAPDDATARRLAREARELLRARRARWYPSSKPYLGRAEDLFLALEGSAQWVAYRWLTDPRGANVAPDTARAAFLRRSKWWSQVQGGGLALAADRVGRGAWRTPAFGDGAQAGVEWLDAALASR